MVKPHNESLVWYDAAAYEAAGGLTASGTSAYSLGAAEGAALMDLFEDIYLGTAGPDFYDLLVGREIPWTQETVVGALQMLVQVAGDDEDIAGGIEGALATVLRCGRPARGGPSRSRAALRRRPLGSRPR
jgi:alpha-glucoside transport system substrate-binding protein